MKTSQVYSVVICNKSFNLTLKKETFDDGYWSSPENEMDKKYENSTVENPSLVARSRRCAGGEKFFPSPPGEASIEAPGQPRRERESVPEVFLSKPILEQERGGQKHPVQAKLLGPSSSNLRKKFQEF